MKTLVLDIPDHLDLDKHNAKMLLAEKLYEQGKLTLGQAAQLVGISKRAFIEVIGKYGFSIMSDSIEDLHSDIKNVLESNAESKEQDQGKRLKKMFDQARDKGCFKQIKDPVNWQREVRDEW